MNKSPAGKADGVSRWDGPFGLVGEKTLVEVDTCQPCLSELAALSLKQKPDCGLTPPIQWVEDTLPSFPKISAPHTSLQMGISYSLSWLTSIALSLVPTRIIEPLQKRRCLPKVSKILEVTEHRG